MPCAYGQHIPPWPALTSIRLGRAYSEGRRSEPEEPSRRGIPQHLAVRDPWTGAAAPAAGVTIALLLLWGLPLTAAQWAVTLGGLAFLLLPSGLLLTSGLATRLLPAERWLLAWIVGYPVGSALYYTGLRTGAEWLVWGAVATAAAMRWWWSRPTGPTVVGVRARPHWSVWLIGPLCFLPGFLADAAFVPIGDAVALARHPDATVHMAFYWELLRGVPPAQVPFAAGVPFPTYHVLAYMPGLFLVRHTGLDIATVYTVISPLLRLSVLVGGVYLGVRFRTGDGACATAALAATFLVSQALELRLEGLGLNTLNSLSYFIRSESGGGAIAVWAVVLALLALDQASASKSRTLLGRPALSAAVLLAGLSFGFKAQAFALLAPALLLGLSAGFLYTKRSELLAAAALLCLVAGTVLLEARREGGLGALSFSPGAFATAYVLPALARRPIFGFDLGSQIARLADPARWVAATSLGLWRLTLFSPLVPLLLLRAWRWRRRLGVADAAAAFAYPVGFGLLAFVSTTELDGRVSPLVARQAVQALVFLSAVVGVVVLWQSRLRRPRADSRWLLLASLLAAAGLALTGPLLNPRWGAPLIIGPDERCVLAYLAEQTPQDAVVASARPLPPPDPVIPMDTLRRYAVISGLAGRRQVLEYLDDGVDPANSRSRDLVRLLKGTPEEAAASIARYRVDYVVQFGPPSPLPVPGRLVLERPTARVFEVARARRPRTQSVPSAARRIGLVGSCR